MYAKQGFKATMKHFWIYISCCLLLAFLLLLPKAKQEVELSLSPFQKQRLEFESILTTAVDVVHPKEKASNFCILVMPDESLKVLLEESVPGKAFEKALYLSSYEDARNSSLKNARLLLSAAQGFSFQFKDQESRLTVSFQSQENNQDHKISLALPFHSSSRIERLR